MNTLSPDTIQLIKATVPALRVHGLAITTRMYDRLFQDPAMRALFDRGRNGPGSQPQALAAAVLAYASNIDRLDVLAPAIQRIAQRHVALGIQPAQYEQVAGCLLAAIADVLGEAATPAILSAWGEAYWLLADVLISAELGMYAAATAA